MTDILLLLILCTLLFGAAAVLAAVYAMTWLVLLSVVVALVVATLVYVVPGALRTTYQVLIEDGGWIALAWIFGIPVAAFLACAALIYIEGLLGIV